MTGRCGAAGRRRWRLVAAEPPPLPPRQALLLGAAAPPRRRQSPAFSPTKSFSVAQWAQWWRLPATQGAASLKSDEPCPPSAFNLRR